MSEPRSVCMVPGCRNSSAKFYPQQYLCSRHWKLVPKRLKRRRSRFARLLVERGETISTPKAWRPRSRRAVRLFDMVWGQMVKAAVQADAGL